MDENIVAKEEMTHDQQFIIVSQCFQKFSAQDALNASAW